MNLWLLAFQRIARRPAVLLAAALGLLLWWCGVLLWLGMPLSRSWEVGALALFTLALLAFTRLGMWMLFRRLGGARLRFGWPLLAGLLPAVVAGGWLPWLLIRWVPGFSSLSGQLASAAVRFLLALALQAGALAWLIALLIEEGQEAAAQDRGEA